MKESHSDSLPLRIQLVFSFWAGKGCRDRRLQYDCSFALFLTQSFHRIDHTGASSWNKAGQKRS